MCAIHSGEMPHLRDGPRAGIEEAVRCRAEERYLKSKCLAAIDISKPIFELFLRFQKKYPEANARWKR